jgi:hypothetical protein
VKKYFGSLHGRGGKEPKHVVDFSKIVNTLGQVISVYLKKIHVTFGGKNNKYKNTNIHDGGKLMTVLIHRVVSCTFIPISEDYKNVRKYLVINHKNDDGCCNLRSNLEWCTGGENISKAFETGMFNNRSFKFTITRPGNLYGKEFYFISRKELEKQGFDSSGVYNFIRNGITYHCGSWEEISREEIKGKPLGIPEKLLTEIRNSKYGRFDTMATVGTIATDGPCKGQKFAIYGTKELKKYGFNQGNIGLSIRITGEICRRCTWERMTREEAVNIPIGLTEEQKKHIFG